jgi:ADP-ribose pyrophosphatase
MKVNGIEILRDEVVGQGGFLAVRRLHLVNVRDDGTRSRSYICDFLIRPKGIDAIVVAVYRRAAGRVEVLLRDGLRIPLAVGRPAHLLPVPDARKYLFFREVVAGIVEHEDRGEDGLRRRAALEVAEEAGYVVRPDEVRLLGAGTFPSPGAMAERFWLAAVEVAGEAAPAEGDGSPMEEGAGILWMELGDAVAACVRGGIEDAKTELVLRRLADELR